MRTDADGVAVPEVLHEHGLDFGAVGQSEETLARLPVVRTLHHYRCNAVEAEFACFQLCPQFFGQRRYGRDVLRQFLSGGAIDLLEPVRLQVKMRGKSGGVAKTGAPDFFRKPNLLSVSNHGDRLYHGRRFEQVRLLGWLPQSVEPFSHLLQIRPNLALGFVHRHPALP